MLDDLPYLSCEDKNVVFQQECDHYTIKVYENDVFRWLTLNSDITQSLISLSEPDRVLLPYTHAMLLALVFKQEPLRLLNLGSGCGTFERFFFKCFPDTSITSVESNIDIINVSRKYFHIPPEHPVLNESADVFLKNNVNKYDIIFCDIHDGEKHPEYLFDLDFYINLKHGLNDDGVLVINLIPETEKMLLDILLSVRKVFGWQYLLEFDNFKNILLYIYKQKPRSVHSNDAIFEELKKRSNIDLTSIIDRLTLLPTAQDIDE